MFASLRCATAAALMLLAQSAAAGAADLTVWSGGAAKAALTEVIAGYAKSTGKAVAADYAPVGALMKRLAATPDGVDILVLSAEAMDEAVKAGRVMPDSITEIGRVGVGVAVNEKAPAPDISTAAAFKATLLAAKSIVMVDPNTGTSGKHLAEVFQKLGVAEAIKPKTTYLQGGYVVERVGTGEIELGLHQITEILPVKGIKLVGPLPAELQKVTIYQAAITAKPRDLAAAKAFLAVSQTPEMRAVIASKGFSSP